MAKGKGKAPSPTAPAKLQSPPWEWLEWPVRERSNLAFAMASSSDRTPDPTAEEMRGLEARNMANRIVEALQAKLRPHVLAYEHAEDIGVLDAMCESNPRLLAALDFSTGRVSWMTPILREYRGLDVAAVRAKALRRLAEANRGQRSVTAERCDALFRALDNDERIEDRPAIANAMEGFLTIPHDLYERTRAAWHNTETKAAAEGLNGKYVECSALVQAWLGERRSPKYLSNRHGALKHTYPKTPRKP